MTNHDPTRPGRSSRRRRRTIGGSLASWRWRERALPPEALEAQMEFVAHLRKLGLDPEAVQGTKTRAALEYFAKILKEAKP